MPKRGAKKGQLVILALCLRDVSLLSNFLLPKGEKEEVGSPYMKKGERVDKCSQEPILLYKFSLIKTSLKKKPKSYQDQRENWRLSRNNWENHCR